MKTNRQHYVLTYGYWLLAIGLLLTAYGSYAQSYEWQWAKHGGGKGNLGGENPGVINNFKAELIHDIVVDEDNNYYFLTTLSKTDTHVDGNPLIDYDASSSYTGAENTLITSFTCEGTYRWSRVIGGGGPARAHKIVLDNNGGLYLSVHIVSLGQETDGLTTHFSEDVFRPYFNGDYQDPQEALRQGFLLKYDTDNGDLLWWKDLQGDVSASNWFITINDLQIDSNNVLHTIVGFKEGVHLDGALTVPAVVGQEDFNHYLVKFDGATGNLLGTPLLLPLEGGPTEWQTKFRYDENLNRYYIGGWQSYSANNQISFNGVDFGQQNPDDYSYLYVISFNPDDLQDWWYREIISEDVTNSSRFGGIEIDSNSDIYIGGSYHDLANSGTVYFGDHTFSNALSYNGTRPFILKMNAQGVVQWSSIPSSITSAGGVNGTIYTAYDVAINGDEVALATVGAIMEWDDFSMTRNEGHGQDPVLVRFDKQTGEVIGMHDIQGSAYENHYLTAVTADNDGNYVVGGAFHWSVFEDSPNGVSPLYNTGGGTYTDFFMARLAATQCGTSVSNEVFHKPQLRLYPNPTNGLVYIAEENLQSYEVYNVVGQRLMSGNSNVINLQELSRGTYIVKVKMQSGSVSTHKIVKN